MSESCTSSSRSARRFDERQPTSEVSRRGRRLSLDGNRSPGPDGGPGSTIGSSMNKMMMAAVGVAAIAAIGLVILLAGSDERGAVVEKVADERAVITTGEYLLQSGKRKAAKIRVP